MFGDRGAQLFILHKLALSVACLCAATALCAQDQIGVVPASHVADATSGAISGETPVKPEPQTVIPALTVVSIEILSTIGSKLSTTGETFPLRLARPVVIDGREVLPAGVTGMGEIIHAKSSGGSGASGELVLTARYLEVDGRRLRLRSLQMSAVGKDQMQLALAAAQAFGPFALAVTGKNIEIVKGRIGLAKTAEAFDLPIKTSVASEAVGAPR
ncbi:MAG: hypothetical protein ABI673_05310 [Novosphingobium sp.]